MGSCGEAPNMPSAICGWRAYSNQHNIPNTNTEFMNPKRNLSLALIFAVLAATPAALACGGGGSGSYRKPARPGLHKHSPAAPASEKGSTAPKVVPQ